MAQSFHFHSFGLQCIFDSQVDCKRLRPRVGDWDLKLMSSWDLRVILHKAVIPTDAEYAIVDVVDVS